MYDIFYIGNNSKLKEKFPTAKKVETFEQAQRQCLTKMFWLVWSDVEISNDFEFDYKADDWSLDVTHVFLNGEHYDGVCLFPKRVQLHRRELDYRFFAEKKEVAVVASNPKKYDKFIINTYEDYEIALKESSTDMFWCVWPESRILDSSIFDLYFSWHNGYDRNENHVFKAIRNNEETYISGVILCSRKKVISKREIDFRYCVNKKECDKVASLTRYDIVFISYQEPDADENYANLKKRFPTAKRIHGVKGIHNAHIEAAKICTTDMFWVVDGDAVITEDFSFSHIVDRYDLRTVHVWHSINPINDLTYGYGGVKLLPRQLTIDMDTNKADMTTSISDQFKTMQGISNTTAFNTDEFSTWRSAFRECVKLASKSIERQDNEETEQRLEAWCKLGSDRKFGKWAISGACAGREYGYANCNNADALKLINDFDWLKTQFKED